MVWPTLGSRTAKEQEQEHHDRIFGNEPRVSGSMLLCSLLLPPSLQVTNILVVNRYQTHYMPLPVATYESILHVVTAHRRHLGEVTVYRR